MSARLGPVMWRPGVREWQAAQALKARTPACASPSLCARAVEGSAHAKASVTNTMARIVLLLVIENPTVRPAMRPSAACQARGGAVSGGTDQPMGIAASAGRNLALMAAMTSVGACDGSAVKTQTAMHWVPCIPLPQSLQCDAGVDASPELI